MLKIKLLNADARLPVKGSEGAAGYDLSSSENAVIPPGVSAILNTGVAVEIPSGFGGFICARSKLGAKRQIQILAGVVDRDYRDGLMVALLNSGQHPLEVKKGDKIAQLVIKSVYDGDIVEVTHLSETERGGKGINCSEMRL